MMAWRRSLPEPDGSEYEIVGRPGVRCFAWKSRLVGYYLAHVTFSYPAVPEHGIGDLDMQVTSPYDAHFTSREQAQAWCERVLEHPPIVSWPGIDQTQATP